MKKKSAVTFRQWLQEVISLNEEAIYRHIFKKDIGQEGLSLGKVERNYRPVIDILLALPKTKAYSMPILVHYSEDWFDKSKYISVCLLNKKFVEPKKGLIAWSGAGRKKAPKGYYNYNLVKHNQFFALSFMPWKVLIDTPIVNRTKLEMDEVVAEILWEFTYYGFSQKEQDNLKEKIIG